MVALSFKLEDSLVGSLRSFSKKKGISQTQIIEESLHSWIKQAELNEIENGFKSYRQAMEANKDLANEEVFLAESTISDALKFIQKEHA